MKELLLLLHRSLSRRSSHSRKMATALAMAAGYYDRTLEAARNTRTILAVGYAYGAQEVDELPLSPLDQSLDWVITERGATRC